MFYGKEKYSLPFILMGLVQLATKDCQIHALKIVQNITDILSSKKEKQ